MAKVTDEMLQELKIKLKNNIKLSREEKKILKENDKEAQEKKKSMSFGERMKLASKSEYSQLMGENEIDNYAVRDYICTGNWLLNTQISGDPFKGLASTRIWQLAGINSSGKTFIMRKTVSNAQKLGYFFVLVETEGANNDKQELKASGIDIENMLLVPTPTVEEMTTTIINLLDEINPGEKLIIGIDSLGGLSTLKELTDLTDGAETADMTRARKLRACFRAITLRAALKNVPIIPLNHTYAIIGGIGGNAIGGGGGSLFNSSIINEFTKAQEKNTAGTETVGACITSTATKCRTAREKSKIKFSISFDNGLKLESGLLDYCMGEKLFVKDGKSNFKMNKETLGKEKFFKEDTITKKQLTEDFWRQFLNIYLADYLRSRFRYQSTAEGIVDDIDVETSEE